MKARLKIIKTFLKKAEKMNLNIDKITEGKKLETLARSSKTIANFKKRFKRQKQQPKLKEEVKKIDIKIQERKEKRKIENQKRQKRNYISKASENISKYNLGNDKPNKSFLRNQTKDVMNDFLNRYFKELRFNVSAQKTIKSIVNRFGVRLDLAYDFMDYISDQSFKYEMPREMMKEEMPSEFNEMLEERLMEFERILNREYRI